MLNPRLTKNGKAVSPVIAVVLMIAVAVAIAIAVIVYAWSAGYASGHASIGSAEAEHLILEDMNLSGTTLTVYIRNKVQFEAVVDSIYTNGVLRAR